MTQNVASALSMLVKAWHHMPLRDQTDLWNILTALRGPDDQSVDSIDMKAAYTAPLRRAVLGPMGLPWRPTGRIDCPSSGIGFDTAYARPSRRELSALVNVAIGDCRGDSHYVDHVSTALHCAVRECYGIDDDGNVCFL